VLGGLLHPGLVVDVNVWKIALFAFAAAPRNRERAARRAWVIAPVTSPVNAPF
jgi:hypothetical protein